MHSTAELRLIGDVAPSLACSRATDRPEPFGASLQARESETCSFDHSLLELQLFRKDTFEQSENLFANGRSHHDLTREGASLRRFLALPTPNLTEGSLLHAANGRH